MEQGASPVIKQPEIEGMSFPDAIAELIAGAKITRISWDDSSSYGIFKDGFLMIHLKGIFHKWIVNDGDLVAKDWIVVKDAN